MAKSKRRNSRRTRRTKRRRVGGLGDRSLYNLITQNNAVMDPEKKRGQCRKKIESLGEDPEFATKEYQTWYEEYKKDNSAKKDEDLICGNKGESYHKNTRYRPKTLDGIGGKLYLIFKQKQAEKDAADLAFREQEAEKRNDGRNYA